MKNWFGLSAIVVLIASFAGCTCGNGCGPGLFSNVNGARIAAPATGTLRYPTQVANVPDPYYGRNTTQGTQPTAAGQPVNNQGWRPSGANSIPAISTPANQSQLATGNTIPSNNLQVATSTSNIRASHGMATAHRPAIQVSPVPGTIAGGMPLTDATHVATTQPQLSNTGIFNRTWEYVARPNTPGYGQVQHQYRTQPVYANGSVVASSSTSPSLSPSTAGLQRYPNGNYPNHAVAEGWRQRQIPR